jgi:hypothetical protein
MTLTDVTDEQPTPTPTEAARDHLTTIRKGWRHVLDPIRVERGGTTQGGPRAETEDDLEIPPDARLDTPLTLAFWVHATVDEWPVTLQTLQPGPDGQLRLTTTESIDCGDVYAMVDFLHREASRIVEWVEPGHDYGRTFVDELAAIARAVARVAWPPKGDRMVIGDCPACGRRLRVKAPTWRRVPHPTTNPDTYPAWSDWQPARDKPITCRCGKEDTLDGWRDALAGPSLALTAWQIIDDVHASLGLRYSTPAVVRQWARQGLITKAGTNARGESLYDRTQVLAALMARESARDERAS